MSVFLATFLLTLVTAAVTALPGVFVVLRRSAMLVDGIGHAVLPGIVAGYVITRNLDSPLLIVGAALSGLVVVLGAELIQRTGLVSGDAPQGLIFPALFAAGVLVISLGFSGMHLDIDVVMLGDLNLVALNQWVIDTPAGMFSLGPHYMYFMAVIGLVNVLFLWLNFRQLKVSTFDPGFARSTGIPTGLVNALFMFLVSITVTAAFQTVGAVLVISLIVAPAATAQLFTHRLGTMLSATIIIAVGVAALGFIAAYHLNLPTSAMLAAVYGAVFTLVFSLRRPAKKSGTKVHPADRGTVGPSSVN